MELVIKRFGELSAEELYEILSLRAETFIAQQKIVYNDLDGLDYRATHVFYLDTPQGEETQGEKTVAAYLRILDPGVIYPQPTIGRVCSRRKGCGIGSKLLRDTIAYLAENTGSSTLLVEAQVSAEAVYRREGFPDAARHVIIRCGRNPRVTGSFCFCCHRCAYTDGGFFCLLHRCSFRNMG